VRTTVSPSPHRKTWDATVRVTGGHPQQLWGIGEAQVSAEGPQLRVDRVMVHDAGQRTVGYAQLYLRSQAERVIAGTVQCHVHRPEDVPVVAGALADWVREEHSAALFRFDADTVDTPGAEDALTAAGFERRGAAGAAASGARRLQVRLGESERDLSCRLSERTLQRCRAALRTPGVTVREVTAQSGVLAHVGLRTRLIDRLLEDLGEDSLLLVATEVGDDGSETALGYLWFVHTGGLAMIYRLGFTRRGRDLALDDALLLTGVVELQKRGVRTLDGGDPAEPDVPLVVRELAEAQCPVLGTWEKQLGSGRAGELTGTADGADATDAAVERTGTAVAAELGLEDPAPAGPAGPVDAAPPSGPVPGDGTGPDGGAARRVSVLTRRLVGEGLSALRNAAGR
jgi:ribosomal protein S18 acetylase RimI-like enzyme